MTTLLFLTIGLCLGIMLGSMLSGCINAYKSSRYIMVCGFGFSFVITLLMAAIMVMHYYERPTVSAGMMTFLLLGIPCGALAVRYMTKYFVPILEKKLKKNR